MKAARATSKGATDAAIFAVNDTVLVKHGIEIFDAKVLRLDENSDTPHYFVHYSGWHKKWDEWVSADRVLDTSPESRELQKQAKLNAKEQVKRKATTATITSSGVTKKKTKVVDPFDDAVVVKDHARDLEEVVQEVQVSIPIPMTLKKILIEDWKKITQEQQWIDLPRVPNVHTVIADYLEHESSKEHDLEITRPMLEGLEAYFDRALPLILLYRQEREQHDEIAATSKVNDDSTVAVRAASAPSSIYGAEHLLRLFVRLPLLMSQMGLDLPQSDQTRIQSTMTALLKFLQKNRQTYFVPHYIASTKFTWRPLPVSAATDAPTK
ncbi:hypothetical protein, variant [Aphanomyces invadans]|uniref:Uncharacterized protein n=1 Tax=Aphanomyces invadans TaxID=157072 RepID=A0A024TDW0_9STRA|nr:hypothetical protein, variant [Aphanomyces invadans]XP_008879781.1 hypothetical protein H310_13908 [Aphanomyces invadans]ETV91512.1 hypothetical protein H310_13908 [Aphanomyces invadans]ETV91513.1 hypothetical protein, variant [Aphanomyces invadans]|eukprot:XP_008879780.1 hypothetical protein, variant [Aphanomyces invadans]